MQQNRVFFSLTTNLNFLWVPYDYAFFIVFGHILSFNALGGGFTIHIAVSFIGFLIVGILKTKDDPNWFKVFLSCFSFYYKNPLNVFLRRVTYYA